MRDPVAAQAYDDALAEAERIDAWSVDSHIEVTLAGLGLADLDRSRPRAELSGGQRARLALAWVLLSAPDILRKSTLLAVLADRLRPTGGSVFRSLATSVGLLTQEVDLPDPHNRGPGRIVLQTYADLVGSQRAEAAPLAAFGLIAGRDEQQPLAALSLGQQRRLALAVLLAHPPDVLLLDEPTNHLSLLLVSELERAILDYPGAVVVASHDRWLRRAWGGQRLDLI